MPEIAFIDSYTCNEEKTIYSVKDLLLELNRVQFAYDTRVIYLKTQKGELTIGIGQHLGFIQYKDSSGEPPYLAAIDITTKGFDYCDFDAGGTPTSIPSIYCLPIARVKDIATYFFVNEKFPKKVQWRRI